MAASSATRSNGAGTDVPAATKVVCGEPLPMLPQAIGRDTFQDDELARRLTHWPLDLRDWSRDVILVTLQHPMFNSGVQTASAGSSHRCCPQS